MTGHVFIKDELKKSIQEKDIWKASGLAPTGAAWYKEIGQGMSQAILMAEQIDGYTLSDRATWLSMKAKSSLAILNQGDKLLFNPYGIISVSPTKWPSTNIAGAKAVGKLIAERAKEKGVTDVVFDRGGYLYHGRVKALADAAREAGLNF